MEVNGLRFWQVAGAPGFGLGPDATPETAAQNLHWRAASRLMRLDRQQAAPALVENQAIARSWASKPSPVRDKGGSFAWFDGATSLIMAGGFSEGATPLAVPPDDPPGVVQPTDMAFGDDDVLYIARNDGVIMVDRRDRWLPARITLPGFSADRLAPVPGGGVWALDRASGQVARLTGYPLRIAGFREQPDDAFRAVEPNPRPPTLRRLPSAKVPAGLEPVTIAASPGGGLAVLAWQAGDDAVLLTLEGRKLVRRFTCLNVKFPYALAWVGEEAVALIATDNGQPAAQALVYELDAPPSDTAAALPVGDTYRLLKPWRGGFTNSLAETPSYPTEGLNPDTPGGVRPLRPLSRATYARDGRVIVGPFDAGQLSCVWDRIYLEAAIPDHAGVRVWATADDWGGRPFAPGEAGAPDWAPHVFGVAAAVDGVPDAPQGAWCAEPSERPFHPGLLPCESSPGRTGLFTAAIQHAGRRVRRIEGRYLWLCVELLGDSQATPEVAAVRAYAARFSYRDRYLPGLYREDLAGPDAEAAGPATPPDFLERFLTLFEGPLTQLETKVANAWLLTDPNATPDDALGWLGRWIGLEESSADAAQRFRQALKAAPWTARLHGTLGGLLAELELATGGLVLDGGRIDRTGDVPRPGELALATLNDVIARALMLAISGDEATVLAGGSVTRGEIVVVEGWRLRRTFATILGADLADEDDPLTLGLVQSGNSFVGDTLFLGDEQRREFLALFDADLPQSRADRAAVAEFFGKMAHRTLVLVRPSPRTRDLGRLLDVAQAAAPAHVEVTLSTASKPLIVGVASLVGLDTFLAEAPPPRRVRIGRTIVGAGDQVHGEGRLDPRADGPVSGRPFAVADGPSEIWSGTGFVMSSARSFASEGRRITRNIWTWD